MKEEYKDISKSLISFQAPKSYKMKNMQDNYEVVSSAWVRHAGESKSFIVHRTGEAENDMFYGRDNDGRKLCFTWIKVEKIDTASEDAISALSSVRSMLCSAPLAALKHAASMIDKRIKQLEIDIEKKTDELMSEEKSNSQEP